jgi:hypothetical protein
MIGNRSAASMRILPARDCPSGGKMARKRMSKVKVITAAGEVMFALHQRRRHCDGAFGVEKTQG